MKRPWAALSLTLCLWGCGADSALIIVTVTGRPSEVTSLQVTTTLNNKKTAVPESITQSLDLFGLLVPPAPQGPILVQASGIDRSGCVAAQGQTDSVLKGQERVQLTLVMSRLPTPGPPSPR